MGSKEIQPIYGLGRGSEPPEFKAVNRGNTKRPSKSHSSQGLQGLPSELP